MAGCGACGGCCAGCGMSCGAFGGFGGGMGMGMGIGMGGSGYGRFGGFGFHPWASEMGDPDEEDQAIDARALANHDHAGHREAIKAISHIDPEAHSKLIEWIKKELANK